MEKPLVLFSQCLPIALEDPLYRDLVRLAHVEIRPKTARAPLARHPLFSKAGAVVSLLGDRLDSHAIHHAPHLKLISNYAVGFNNVDLAAAQERGVVVCNTPDVLTNATAELTIGLLFAAARRFKEGHEMIRKNSYKGWEPMLLLGRELSGAKLGIVGYGRIGQAVAKKAHALGMTVTHTKGTDLKEILKTSDFISIHCPLTPGTKGLLGPKQFTHMKKGAFLINTSRGDVVDEKALLGALKDGTLRGAALDVFDGEPKLKAALRANPNVFVLPHLGSATIEARSAMARLAIDAVVEVFSGRTPRNRVV